MYSTYKASFCVGPYLYTTSSLGKQLLYYKKSDQQTILNRYIWHFCQKTKFWSENILQSFMLTIFHELAFVN